jgi:glycosyltransferase involved in cell wall biosynthesis
MSEPSAHLVTVVIATYNMGRYLPEAVQSILCQTYPHVHVQIVDDGSTDDTPAICATLAADPRVSVHQQANAGQAKAKNKGISLARGAFVAFLDADDLWVENKLALQMPLFEGRPEVGVVYSNYQAIDAQGTVLPKLDIPMFRGQISAELLMENFVSFPSAIVRRECLERFGGFDESYDMGIDYELWLRLSAHYQFDYVPEATVRYRIWAGQMSKNFRKRYASAIRIMSSFLEKNPGVVDPALARRAWAQVHVGRGNNILWQERKWNEALRDYARALTHRPYYWPAWRAIARSLITRRAPRPG